MKRTSKMDELRWVRLFTGSHIPRYLVDQIAKRDYEIEDFYQFVENNLLRQTQEGPTLNPLFHLWALVNEENLVRGFLWFTIDPLTKDMVIQVYSVDSNYWGSREAIKKLAEHMKEIRRKAKLNKIYWITKFPKHSLKYGFKPSKNVLMEYNEEDEEDGSNIDGGPDTHRKRESTHSRTAELPNKRSGRTGRSGESSLQPVSSADGSAGSPSGVSEGSS